MKINKLIIISLILMASLTLISTVSAEDMDDLNLTSEINDMNDNNLIANDENPEAIESDSCCEDETGPQTWIVEPDSENPNQVQKPTVQPTIDKANPGDTIILNGTFVHCHFMINKTLTILATPGTSVGVCPHHTHMMKYGEGPETNGIFYISPEANGTIISGFSFTNDYYYIANNVYNPFGIYVDANDVTLTNLTFNWIGMENSASKFNPKDFLFDAIILNNTQNSTISDISLGSVNTFITSNNASEIKSKNISIVKISEEVKELLNSNILVSNINVLAGDSANLQFTLNDDNGKSLSGKEVIVIIDGIERTVTVDSNGMAKVPVKYASSGTHYVTISFMGDEDYKASLASSKIVVSKKSTSLTTPKATLKVNKAKKISITLKANGKAVYGKKITFKVNGKTFSAKTNSKGVASIKVKVSKKGTFKYRVKFAGDGTYKSMSKTGKLIVKK